MGNMDYLISKYNKPVPRYTSYPTVPHWENWENSTNWISCLTNANKNITNELEGVSLYVHLPFCESLCTYCACNKRITTNHKVEERYVAAILKEWLQYQQIFDRKIIIKALHLGGGTPTFFSPKNLEKLITGLLNNCELAASIDFSIEGHPNNTTEEHLTVLYNLGFKRISYGVQDLDSKVQIAINRIQPLEQLQQATSLARSIGFTSINYDLVYGLPFQTLESMKTTLQETISLRPDRIAFYSYAHVPWKQKGQRLFNEDDLPSPSLKNMLYQRGKEMFATAGYFDIGMDHFALPNDDLFIAKERGKLHRNFMGYTDIKSDTLVGLGVSAISENKYGYAQNHKELELYYRDIDENKLPITKGYQLTKEDSYFKQGILQLICSGQMDFEVDYQQVMEQYSLERLKAMEADALLVLKPNGLVVTPLGKQFIRNVCQALDIKWLSSHQQIARFSQAI